ncbi:hypothetical protein GH714_038867 [Hevea brasiliensis]|uniref:Pentacotripeptide-repeat region of PRORP domain-containing protein n=1 Tax=Hevea brasiliensis TaxID=3981 RepID=A0A6A6MQN2_HEVBR|nr:hypothetical protein GH714_038867 [Hevea brasiliensis]
MKAQSVMAGSTSSLCFVGSLKRIRPRFIVFSQQREPTGRALARKIIWEWKRDQSVYGNDKEIFVDCASLIHTLHWKRMPHLAHELLLEMKSQGFLPSNSTLSAMMLCYANNGLFPQAQVLWEELLNSSFMPSIQTVAQIFDAYGKWGLFNEVMKILDQLSYSNFSSLHEAYSLAISCFGKGGQLQLMEKTLKEMILRGFPVDSATGNAFIRYSSIHGSLTEMEAAYIRLKRKDVGNLIWNFLLLSYAANFKMKSLQREFLSMLEAGFSPDLTTFNIRALAFSRMALLWDLHLSIEHMKHEKVSPDLVTYGCVVDAYLDRRLGKNLDFALNKMNLDVSPVLSTDPSVFEVLGKGDFHSSAEAFLESSLHRKWTYRELVSLYLRKQYRSNQIFWNY